MKIESGRRVSPSSAPRRAAAAAPGFAPDIEATQPTGAVASVGAVTPLDAIIALQSEEPMAQRRSRQLRRGQDALDALERLEQGLLLGRAPAALRAEIESLRQASAVTGEAGLDQVLREIDIRLAVEAAKLDRLLGRQ